MGMSRHICVWTATGLASVFMVGCAGDQRPHDVPSSAMRKVEGNQRLVYTASDPGTLWVTEGASNIIYSTPVHAADRVVLDPDAGKVMLNDQVVLDKDVNHKDHKVFFLPGTSPAPVAVAASDRSLSRPAGIPMTAMIGGEGKDRVEYTTPGDGFIWVADQDQNRVLYSAPASRGDVVVVDPRKNLITVNSQSVYSQNIGDHNHRVFFSNERPALRSADPAMKPGEVPSDAINRLEGTGRIDFVADRDGTVWIADMTLGHAIYAGRILKGDRLTIDPGANLLTLNGQPVYMHELPHDRYRVFFSER